MSCAETIRMDTGVDEMGGSGDGSGVKRPYPAMEGGVGGDSDTDDPKRLCIDEEGGNLQCPRCSYVAKWKSDLERHMKVSPLLVMCLT